MLVRLNVIAILFSTIALCNQFATNALGQWVPQVLPVELQVGYAVRTLDMNGDGKLDILITDSKRFLWLENPTWQSHVIHATPQAKNDNVCMAPYDIDQDGKVDLAIGHDWQPNNTKSGGEIGWLKSPEDPRKPWKYFKIAEEPTTHRMNWGDLNQDGRLELIVLPLKGRNTVAPGFDQAPVRLLHFEIPGSPEIDPWPMKVIDESKHVSHNFEISGTNASGYTDILSASFEGAVRIQFSKDFQKTDFPQGPGHQGVAPARGSSEIRRGLLQGNDIFLATIEPWHGDQVVVYSKAPGEQQPLMRRSVIDNELKWGHAVACANLDSDSEDEIVIGVRDDANAPHRCGIRVYDFQAGNWVRSLVEPGQVAVEDMVVADLDEDGRKDIIAVGRATHNAVIYWNR
jgi:hypothetical protein